MTPREELFNTRFIDVYQKRVAVRCGSNWQWAYVAPGFCAVADWCTPNQHIGIMRTEDALGEDPWTKPIEPINGNIAILWGGFVDDQTLSFIDKAVRFGRTDRVQGSTIIIDGPGTFDYETYVPEAHEADWDDRNCRSWAK